MSVTIVTGHRLEDLFAVLCEQFKISPPGPMDTETILVPGKGIARWLELRFAEHLGIAAGIEMPFLGTYLHRLSAHGKPGQPAPADPFARDVLVLRLWRLISDRLATTDTNQQFGAATAYCKDDPDGRKRLQLCQRLAACYDDYQLYRHELLTDFAAGENHKALSPHAPWQAQIWRALLEDAGLQLPRPRSKKPKDDATPYLFAEMSDLDHEHEPTSNAAHRLVAIHERLQDAQWCNANLPKRLSVFGTTTMPPAFLDLLHTMGRHTQVHLYVPQPTPHYIGDLRERKNRAGDNALLARFGTESREFSERLLDLEDRGEDAPSIERQDLDDLQPAGPASNLLHCLQQDIVHAHDRGETPKDRFSLHPKDASLRVHDCHSPQRELEVVRDQICAALDEDKSLEARDIMVLVPDIDRYAPYAHAVFGPLRHRLPFYVADRNPARELPICRSVLTVLELANTRLTLVEVLHLLENPAIRRRYQLFATDIPILRHLCQTAGIRWGLDGEHRERQFGVPAFEDNAWLPGIDRLLLGTLTGPAEELILERLPVGDTTESRVEIIARFTSFTRTLFHQLEALRRDHTFAEWAERVDTIAAELFSAQGGDEEDALEQLQSATKALRKIAATAEHNQPVPLAVAQDWLHEQLAQGAPARGFLGGSVTIAAMLPMRAVPVRCLFLCGLDDESFPRRQPPSTFDLIQAQPRPLDRNRRLDDRQLFLDLLLAARDRLHLSFVGRSAKDNAEGAPSVVLAELFDHVDRTCRAHGEGAPHEEIVVKHPLQPWSHHYHTADDPRLFTYGQATQPLRRPSLAVAEPWCPETFALPTTVDQPERITVDELLAFWWHPCRAFLREALRIRVRNQDEQEEADEPFSIGPLARYQLQDEAVRNAQRGVTSRDEPLDWTRAKGVLPVGSHGVAAFHNLRAESQELLNEARLYAATTSRRIDLDLGDAQIVGSLEGFGEDQLAYLRVSKLKPKDRLKAWLMHLIVTLQRIQDGADAEAPWPTTTRIVTGGGVKIYPEVPEEVAREHLTRLVTLRRRGLTRPLPFFEQTSFDLGQRLHKNRTTEQESLLQARKKFTLKDPRDAWQYDEGDAAIALCMRERDPFAGGRQGEFFELAKDIWPAPISYLGEPG